MAVPDAGTTFAPQETAICSIPVLPNQESGCRAATCASQSKHNAIPTRGRQARSRSQKEAVQRARQLRAGQSRFKRSATTSFLPTSKALGRPIDHRHRQTISLPATRGSTAKGGVWGALEPPHEQFLAKMAFAEQQQWITVQQKTFTKW
jgi:hypothetical protein